MEISKVDEMLVRAAMGKELEGFPLSGEESRALRRWEKADWEKAMDKAYAAMPKKRWCAYSGRSHQVLGQQAERYGLSALTGPTIDLRVLARQIHDFLAKNWLRFERDIEAAELLTGGAANSPNMERYRGYKADLAALEVEEKQGELLPRAEVRAGMLVVAGIIRTMGEHLEREYGAGARELLDAALDDCVVKIGAMFDSVDS
jgi:hypothetical protein